MKPWGTPGGSVVEHLPSAQGVILGSQDRVPHRTPLGETASHSAMFLPLLLCVSLTNKKIKHLNFKKERTNSVTRDEEGHFFIIKKTLYQDQTTKYLCCQHGST